MATRQPGATVRAMPRTFALIVAAGRGHRLGGAVPKQFLPLAGEPMLRRTTKVFVNHPGIDGVAVGIHPGGRALYDGATQGLGVVGPLAGGGPPAGPPPRAAPPRGHHPAGNPRGKSHPRRAPHRPADDEAVVRDPPPRS